MPPPNVTAPAHIGHGSTYTAMDTLVRYHRMLGENADWLPGLDHAAVATEAVLVRALAREGRTRDDLGRETYLRRAWEWAQTYGGTIEQQFRRLGFGPDWQRSRFTMDEGLSKAVRRVFVALYREGLIYRAKRLVNWDPKAQTTISDAEVEHEERDGFLWTIRYPGLRYANATPDDNEDGITIATTRPETMLADVAIAVHPEDARYAHLIGKSVLAPPLLERAIPIIADRAVDPEFGTGAVKVTPAHDALDDEIGTRNGLPAPSVIDQQGRISGEDVPVGRYEGMETLAARSAMLDDLRERGLLVEECPHRHAVAVSDRTGAVIEPLPLLQWFVRMQHMAGPALGAYQDGRLRFVPERYGRTYETWLRNIRDWNVSRQVWWGHQLPVWYTPDGETIVAESEEEASSIAQARYGGCMLTRDPDTLDTWFSSALWPFTILGWPQQTPELEHWYPSQVLITGGEIVFLWVARMVMLGLKFMGSVPFPDVFVAPLVFDLEGRKMSKSLGNVIDPLQIVDKYGADALRMGMMRQMRIEAQEIRFNESRCEEARRFNNKVWNATNFVLSLPEGLPAAMSLPPADRRTVADRWILTQLHDVVLSVGGALDRYDFGEAAETIWRFIWYEFCDWYLEAAKDPHGRSSRAAVLSFVLNHAMRLLHPIEPFISEEVWLRLPHDGETIVTASWPDRAEIPVDREQAELFATVMRCVQDQRNLRAELEMKPNEPLELEVPQNVPDGIASLLATLVHGTVVRTAEDAGSSAEALALVRPRVPPDVLQERYMKEAQRLRGEIERGERKLGNASFTSKANPAVVEKEREKLQRYRDELERVNAARDGAALRLSEGAR